MADSLKWECRVCGSTDIKFLVEDRHKSMQHTELRCMGCTVSYGTAMHGPGDSMEKAHALLATNVWNGEPNGRRHTIAYQAALRKSPLRA